jgi:predicted neuraminidase
MTTRKQKTIEQPKKNGSRKKSDKPSNFVQKNNSRPAQADRGKDSGVIRATQFTEGDGIKTQSREETQGNMIPVCRKTRGEQRRSQKTGNDDNDDDDDMAIGIRRPTFAIAEKLDMTSQVQTGS